MRGSSPRSAESRCVPPFGKLFAKTRGTWQKHVRPRNRAIRRDNRPPLHAGVLCDQLRKLRHAHSSIRSPLRVSTRRAHPRGDTAPMTSILVTGSHRSGTGWVGHVLAASPRPVGYVWEPFSILHRPGTCAARFEHWFPYICDENEARVRGPVSEMLAWRYAARAELACAALTEGRRPDGPGRRPLSAEPALRRHPAAQGSHRSLLGGVA